MSQQRTSALRRVRPNIRGVQFATVDWVYDSNAAGVVFFRIDIPPGTQVNPLTGYALDGIPQIFNVNSAAFPIAAELQDPYLKLTYAVDQSAPQQWRLSPNDAALRGPFGEYLCAKTLVLPSPPVVPANTVGTTIVAGALDVTIAGFTGPLGLAMRNLPLVRNETQAVNALAVSTDGTSILATFAAPPLSGDSVSFGSDAANWLNVTGGSLQNDTLIIP